MIEQETREAILRWMSRPQYSPVKATTLAQQIGLLKEDFPAFKKLIQKMRREGMVTYGAQHIIYPVAETLKQGGQVVGYFKRLPEGYGFVSETNVNPTPETMAEESDDIYIPPGKAMDAATGDFVSVILDRNTSHGRRRGRRDRGRSGAIDRIVERASHTFVGTFHERHADGWVEVDGKIFSDEIHVGDATANRVREGDKVVIDMIRFPSAWRAGEAVITEILGPRGDMKTETKAIMRQYGLQDDFPDDVVQEARHVVEEYQRWESDPNRELGHRRDLSGLYVITIDPADARDFDDAISIENLPNGNVKLGVHIADVSFFVRPDTRIDKEAYDRGNSTYLPDKVIPMLPEALSNGLASLQPEVARVTKTVFQTFAPNGLCVDVEICDSLIQSNCRLNYEQVDRFFDGDTTELPAEVRDVLERFRALARNLRARRYARGMLMINLPEIRLTLDVDGNVTGVRREENTESHQMIEEFMVSANEAVAQTLMDAQSNLMRRVHKPPALAKLDALGDFLDEIGISMESSADRFELQKVLEKSRGTADEFPVNQAVLRAMQRAEYSPEEEGHFALASDCYCHFTSPIRRYADLTIHRQIEDFIVGKNPKRNFRKIYDEGRHLSFTEQNSEDAENELTRVKMIHFFQQKGETELAAHIVGVTRHGFFIRCDDYPLQGLVSLQTLPRDQYHFDGTAQKLSGFHAQNQYQLGMAVKVKVSNINADKREIQFELAGMAPTEAPEIPSYGRTKREMPYKKLDTSPRRPTRKPKTQKLRKKRK
ncbi:MAG: VacB/RNase II family 3'-5' exoribonuclease [Planctomycetia bacterium]|nr:VacB/RNase II family 3'-5' exoribonuclease [Planctomycetia bacterium]